MTTIIVIVLIQMVETPVSFARVESILPDAKKDWFQVKLLMLQIPLQVVTWILKESYINGDTFLMNGKKMRLDRVECPIEEMTPLENARKKRLDDSKDRLDETDSSSDTGRIISFEKIKKTRRDHEPDPG
jgi:hypothetical protein